MGKASRRKRELRLASAAGSIPTQETRRPSTWLYSSELIDEGAKTAVYPYVLLKDISTLGSVRPALLDETARLEREFGQGIVDPLYQLIWTLNGCAGMFTSHMVLAPVDYSPPYAWAQAYVAAAIILLSRDRRDHHNLSAANNSAEELRRLLFESPQITGYDVTGWKISVGPVNVIFTNEMSETSFEDQSIVNDRPGFGCQLIIGGAAGTREEAARRWSLAMRFVRDTINEFQHRNGGIPAPPHQHYRAANSTGN